MKRGHLLAGRIRSGRNGHAGVPLEITKLTIDIDHLRGWIGQTAVQEDAVTSVQLEALTATLDRSDAPIGPDAVVPPCWHWLYFLPHALHSEIGVDGHPRRGGYLPPVPLPRRMWAASRMKFRSPLRVGQRITRTSRIADVQMKEGRTGPLIFVGIDHEIKAEGQVAISERQDIVYRDMPSADGPTSVGTVAPQSGHWCRVVQPSEVLLFRYSALTFNAHRIHYDRRYSAEVEGYPGLVVHAPLIATLLLDLLHRSLPEGQVTSFTFRAMTPLNRPGFQGG